MKLKAVNLKVSSAVFFWDEGEGAAKHKEFATLAPGDEFEVKDEIGHEIIAKYKGIFQVISYGGTTIEQPLVKEEEKVEVKKAVAESPRNKMIEEERAKLAAMTPPAAPAAKG